MGSVGKSLLLGIQKNPFEKNGKWGNVSNVNLISFLRSTNSAGSRCCLTLTYRFLNNLTNRMLTFADVSHTHSLTHTFTHTHTPMYVTKSTNWDIPIDISQNGRRGDNNPKSLMTPMDGNCKTQWIGKCFVSSPIITQTGEKEGIHVITKVLPKWPNEIDSLAERVLRIK